MQRKREVMDDEIKIRERNIDTRCIGKEIKRELSGKKKKNRRKRERE